MRAISAVVGLSMLLGASAGATSISNLFGTGSTTGSATTFTNYLNNTSSNAPTWQDTHWNYNVVFDDNSQSGLKPALIDNGSAVLGSWISNASMGSSWVGLCDCQALANAPTYAPTAGSPTVNPVNNTGGEIAFQTTFSAGDDLNAATTSISFNVALDDVGEVLLNNVLIAYVNFGGAGNINNYGSGVGQAPHSFTLTQGQSGIGGNVNFIFDNAHTTANTSPNNTLEIIVFGDNNYDGVNVDITGAGDGQNPAPEPGSAILIALGLGAVAAGVRRRKRT